MDSRKEIEMKQHVLELLKEFMMGEEGSKFKPKEIQVEMMGEPEIMPIGNKVADWQKSPKGAMAEEADKFREEHDQPWEGSPEDEEGDMEGMRRTGMDESEWEESPEDEEHDKKGRMSLKDFLASRSE